MRQLEFMRNSIQGIQSLYKRMVNDMQETNKAIHNIVNDRKKKQALKEPKDKQKVTDKPPTKRAHISETSDLENSYSDDDINQILLKNNKNTQELSKMGTMMNKLMNSWSNFQSGSSTGEIEGGNFDHDEMDAEDEEEIYDEIL